MDKYMKRSFTKLRTALAILIACCLTTDMYAQTAVAADSVATDTVAQLVSGVNTVWMLLAAMLVFFMQPGFALVEAGFTRTKNTHTDEKLCGLHVRLTSLLAGRFRHHVRFRRLLRNSSPHEPVVR